MTARRTAGPQPFVGLLIALCFLVLGVFAADRASGSSDASLAPRTSAVDEVTLSVPANVTLSDIDRVLVFVAQNRKWSIDTREPGRVELSLKHREFDAHLIITYDERQLIIHSQSTGRGGRPAVPTRWLNNLVSDVQFQFNAKRP